MAEVAIGIVKEKLVPLLTAEVSLLKDVEKDVTKIVSQLEISHSLLKNADKRVEEERDNGHYGIKEWVQELREVAFQIEDLVTEYTHHVAEQPPDSYEGGFQDCLQQIASFLIFCCSGLPRRHILASEIRDINVTFNEIYERGIKDGFINSIRDGSMPAQNADSSYDPRKHAPYIEELVGMESARDELVNVLLDDQSSTCTIIPVVGPGGSGKTSLSQKVYKDVQGRFQCHAWIEVPQPYKTEEILRKLTRELLKSAKAPNPDEILAMDEKELIDNLREYLKGKKYLVIFDDVWKEDFWGIMRHALIDGKVGGRIMITTRHMQVAEFCASLSTVHIHQMQRLSIQKSWELFCQKTFRLEGRCPEELEKISGHIVERCEGLPLAIVVIAGFLSTKKKTFNEWRRFHDNLSSELENNVHLKSITKILSLSYYELPYHLKSCLLYFGIFPGRYSIRNGRLIRQWIAEGFVKAVKGMTSEEVAQEYMNDLINRSLVEASELDVTGKPKKCRVHDLLHEIICKKAEEVRFAQVLMGSSTDQSKLGGIIRRLAIMDNSSNDVFRSIAFSHSSAFSPVHSAVIFCEDETLNSFVPKFAINFKFIKVLDFEDAPRLKHLPEDIGNLFDLRYLSVRGTEVARLPESIGKLENLETLLLEKSLVCEIPSSIICKLCKLRHLLGYKLEAGSPFGVVGIKMVGGIGGLKSLQKLCQIEAEGEGVYVLFKELENLTQLKTLGMSKLRREDGKLLCGGIEKMKLLESLFVKSTSENEFVDLECMSSPPQLLRNINLKGRLHKLPKWFTQLQNLIKLRLGYSMLKDDPLEVLGKMPNLLELTIGYDAYVGEQLHFREGMFPKLKNLALEELNKLCSWIMEETTLPVLEELYIGPCPQMKEVPSGLQHLQYLKILVFNLMPLEFLFSQDFRTVSYVSEVQFFSKDREGKEWLVGLPDLPHWLQEYWNEDGETEKQDAQDRASTSKSTIDEQ